MKKRRKRVNSCILCQGKERLLSKPNLEEGRTFSGSGAEEVGFGAIILLGPMGKSPRFCGVSWGRGEARFRDMEKGTKSGWRRKEGSVIS